MDTRFLIAIVFIAIVTTAIISAQTANAFVFQFNKQIAGPSGQNNQFSFQKATINGITTCKLNGNAVGC